MLMMGEEYNSNKPTKSERMTKIVNDDFLTGRKRTTEASHDVLERKKKSGDKTIPRGATSASNVCRLDLVFWEASPNVYWQNFLVALMHYNCSNLHSCNVTAQQWTVIPSVFGLTVDTHCWHNFLLGREVSWTFCDCNSSCGWCVQSLEMVHHTSGSRALCEYMAWWLF